MYLIYGLHFCINAVCRPRGIAEAILVRAIEIEFGETWIRRQRRVKNIHDLTNGPAKLCAALAINRGFDGANLCNASSPVFIARNPDQRQFLLSRTPMITTTRVGITKAAELPLRFYLAGSPFISKRARHHETNER